VDLVRFSTGAFNCHSGPPFFNTCPLMFMGGLQPLDDEERAKAIAIVTDTETVRNSKLAGYNNK